MVGGWSTPRPGRFTPEKDPVPLYRKLGGPQGRCGQVWNISPLPGFDPRTVQRVASRYTDCAIPAPRCHIYLFITNWGLRFTISLPCQSVKILVSLNATQFCWEREYWEIILTFSRLMTHTHTHTHTYIYIYIYMSCRTANLQMLHFIYLFNKYTYWIY